jgi:parallel beta-helix repeat protein
MGARFAFFGLSAALTVLISSWPVPELRAAAVGYFAAPDGAAGNPGTIERPLDLVTALSTSSPVGPGDTLWLRGGTYHGLFRSYLTGTSAAPIIVRNYRGERVTIDGSPQAQHNQDTALLVRGAWTWYWGFEVMFSHPQRRSAIVGAYPTDLPRGSAIETYGDNVRFINMVVHDGRMGHAFWTPGENSEIYGNIVYYNGWQDPNSGWGHGIYTHNQNGTKHITDNIIFDNFSHGIHTYNSSATSYIDNIVTTGNISFNNGSISENARLSRNILHGGEGTARNVTLSDNFTYHPDGTSTGENNLGYSAGCANAVITNNRFIGGRTAFRVVNCSGLTIAGNLFQGPIAGFTTSAFPLNTYHSSKPTGTEVFVRPNRYELGRAHVVIYNWSGFPSVEVDLAAAGLTIGQRFEIRDAQSLFGAPVAAGVFNGSRVAVPMTGLTIAPAVGDVPAAPRHTAPEFGAFVVLPVTAGLQAPTGLRVIPSAD